MNANLFDILARGINMPFEVPVLAAAQKGRRSALSAPKASARAEASARISPTMKAAGALTGWLGQRFPGCVVEPDLEAVPALQPERDALWARLAAAAFLTVEERRRMAGLGQLEAGE